jgi:uncharacterized protein YgbK (DUF1537 family)
MHDDPLDESLRIKPMSATLSKSATLTGLPPEWPEDLLADIQARIKASGRKVVVLDDDPTGTQTVHGVPVLTTWSVAALARELEGRARAFYILTNSRSLTAEAANQLGREIGANLARASRQTGTALEVISRSDSTLRGHFPGEVDALKEGLGTPSLPCLLVPFFLEGGRFTIGNIHYVAEGDRLVPAAQTPYARDAVFGYRHSHLSRWIEEKSRHAVAADQIDVITLEDLRQGGPLKVAHKLVDRPPHSYTIANAADYRDLEVLVAGLLAAESTGKAFIFRTAASFVRVRAGIAPRDLLQYEELTVANRHGGLFVVGSYVPKTSTQLAALLRNKDLAAVEIAVDRLLRENDHETEIQRATDAMNRAIGGGVDAVVYTSRQLVTGTGEKDSLAISRRVSDSLIRIVQGLDYQPRYLVAKGGITSSDVATRGLGVARAEVLGQVLPGVPAWQLGKETRYPGMAYIVFPGNVGEDSALADIQQRLARRNRDR